MEKTGLQMSKESLKQLVECKFLSFMLPPIELLVAGVEKDSRTVRFVKRRRDMSGNVLNTTMHFTEGKNSENRNFMYVRASFEKTYKSEENELVRVFANMEEHSVHINATTVNVRFSVHVLYTRVVLKDGVLGKIDRVKLKDNGYSGDGTTIHTEPHNHTYSTFSRVNARDTKRKNAILNVIEKFNNKSFERLTERLRAKGFYTTSLVAMNAYFTKENVKDFYVDGQRSSKAIQKMIEKISSYNPEKYVANTERYRSVPYNKDTNVYFCQQPRNTQSVTGA